MKYKQYSVVIVNLNPTVGFEIKKTRPCVVISPDEMNYGTLIIAPLTSKYRDFPTRIKIENDSYIVLDQIRTISIKRVTSISKTKLTNKTIKAVKNLLKVMLVD